MPLRKPVFLTPHIPLSKKPSRDLYIQVEPSVSHPTNDKDAVSPQIDLMKSRSRSASGSPRELVRLRAWRLDTAPEAPQLTFDELGGKLKMDNGLFGDELSPDKKINGGLRIPSSPPIGATLRSGLMSPIEEPPSSTIWSSAVGHASTGKSGRVIEKLQADIDRLNRDKLVWKARFEEAEKTNETLNARNTSLSDRNSNLEQSHEANSRQLARKDRMIEELRENLRREKLKTETAERNARTASETEEAWREEAAKARAVALQKEHEYESIASCRSMDNDRYQSSFDRLKNTVNTLLNNREADLEAQRRLGLIAEQQSRTIEALEEANRKLTMNSQTYKAELDGTIGTLRSHAEERGRALTQAEKKMNEAADKMRWVVNVKRNLNGAA